MSVLVVLTIFILGGISLAFWNTPYSNSKPPKVLKILFLIPTLATFALILGYGFIMFIIGKAESGHLLKSLLDTDLATFYVTLVVAIVLTYLVYKPSNFKVINLFIKKNK